jgi:peptidylprolyl isomerase domain and WD repeat-containing protein 1
MSNADDSDDDFGPMPAQESDEIKEMPTKKKARVLEFESLYLEKLPSADYYEHSYMHRDIVTHIVVSKPTEFVITGSSDGHVKFWKKMTDNVEFVKHYQAHLGPIHAMTVSSDGKRLVTTSSDKMIKFFEISGFDMTSMITCTFTPTAAIWLAGPHNINDRVAVADANSGLIRIYKSESDSSAPLHEINLHMQPVKSVIFTS